MRQKAEPALSTAAAASDIAALLERGPWSLRVRALAGAGALAWVVLTVLGPVLLSAEPEVLGGAHTDLFLQFLPWRQFGFAQLARGHLPLWNPHIYGGAPYFAEPQSALLYLPNLLFLVLPLSAAVNWTIALNLWLMGVFMYLWGLRRGLRTRAAWVSGVCLMLSSSDFAQIYAGHLTNMAAMTWVPLIFASSEGWIDSTSRRTRLGAWLLCVFAVAQQILAGHPQYVYYTALLLGAYALCYAREMRRPWLRACAGWLGLYLASAVLTAVQLLPSIESTRESLRAQAVPYAFAAMFPFPLENLLTLIAPFAYGDDIQLAYWGRWYLWEATLFISVGGLACAAYGACYAQLAGKRAALCTLALSALLAVGTATPLFALLYHWVPGFDRFRSVGKVSFFAALFLCMFAGAGVDRVLRRRTLEPRALAVCAALAVGAATLAWWASGAGFDRIVTAIASQHESYLPAERYTDRAFLALARESLSRSLAVSAATFALWATWSGLLRVQPWASATSALAPWLVAAELLWFASASTTSFDPDAVVDPRFRDFLAQHPGDYRVFDAGRHDHAMALGAFDAWGYDPGVSRRYAELVASTQGVDAAAATQYVSLEQAHPLLALLRLRYVRRQSAQGGQIIELPTPPLPRFSLVGSYRVVRERAARLSTMLAPEFDPRALVLLEERPEPEPLPDATGQIRVLSQDTDSAELSIDTNEPSILLITDVYARGWRCDALAGSVQSSYRLLVADHALRAVALGAGKHHLRMAFRPASIAIGAWISALACAAYVIACVLAYRMRERTCVP